MATNFAFMLTLGAALSSSFTGAFAQAGSEIQKLQSRQREMRNSITAIADAQRKGIVSASTYKTRYSELETQLMKNKAVLDSLARAENNYQSASEGASRARSMFGTSLVAGALLQKTLGGATKTAMNFEFEMAKVKAISGATDEEFSVLNNTAKKLGATTQYTSAEVSAGMRYLAMAGFKTNQIVGAMPGLLSLAAAGNVDLARASDIVSDTMTAFGIDASRASKVADIFAVTATSTNTNVEMLGETMKYAAPIAKAFGASLEETSALAGLMANSGIKAGQAGTALRSGMLRLAGPPRMAAKALDKLGISLEQVNAQQQESRIVLKELGIDMENSKGPRKMATILEDLRNKMKDMSEDQKLATTKAIFGTEGASAWLAVLDQGGPALETLTKNLEQSEGAADKMAKIMQNNARGALIAASSAAESFAIAIGSTMLPALQNVAGGAAKFAGKMAELSEKYPTLIKLAGYATVGLTGFFIALTGGVYIYKQYLAYKMLSALLMKSENIALAINAIGVYKAAAAQKILSGAKLIGAGVTKGLVAAQTLFNLALAACPIGWVLIGLASLVVAGGILYKNWDAVQKFFSTMWDIPLVHMLLFFGPIGQLIWVTTAIISNWDTIKAYFEYFWDNPSAAIFRFTSYLEEQFGKSIKWIRDKWDGLSKFLSTPIFGTVTSKGATGAPIQQNAFGGIYGRGAFLTAFAERDGESAIPHTPNRRNIGLLAKTNSIMGNPLGGKVINASFSPTVNISGGGDVGAVKAEMDNQRRAFEQMLNDLLSQRERVSYA